MIIKLIILLIQVVFSLLVYLGWIRFLLQWGTAPVNNIFTQQIIKVSNPILKPFQLIVGTYKNYNIAALLFLLILNIAEILIMIALYYHTMPDIGGLLLWALIKMLLQACQIVFYGTIVYALMSWFPSLVQSPLGQCIIAIIDPIVGVFRRFIPTIGIFDLSAMALIITIIFIQFLLNTIIIKAVALALA
jgi:YggT family protein